MFENHRFDMGCHLIIKESLYIFYSSVYYILQSLSLFMPVVEPQIPSWVPQLSLRQVITLSILGPVFGLLVGFMPHVFLVFLLFKFVMNCIESFKQEESENWTFNAVLEKFQQSFQKTFADVVDLVQKLVTKVASYFSNGKFDFFSGIRYEMRETPDSFIVHMDIPGVKKEEINVEIQEDVITVSGCRKSEGDEKEKQVFSSIPLGDYSTTVKIPKGVDKDRIVAKYENGVLSLLIPKKQESIHTGSKIHIE